jgi:hypothetical protein
MGELVKEGAIGKLEVVNVAAHPEQAQSLGVHTVPWLRIGFFELEGAMTLGELREWVRRAASPNGIKDYFVEMLKTGHRDKVEKLIRQEAAMAAPLADIMADPDSSMAVRLGIGAVLEEFQGTGLTETMIPKLAELAKTGDDLTRADACHFLTLIGGTGVIPHLQECLNDKNEEVREIAREALNQ